MTPFSNTSTHKSDGCWSSGLIFGPLLFPQIHDIFHVFPQTREDVMEFLFASECRTGFRHLYRIAAVLKESRYKRSCGGLPAPSNQLDSFPFGLVMTWNKLPSVGGGIISWQVWKKEEKLRWHFRCSSGSLGSDDS